jgi:hypothetical protein
MFNINRGYLQNLPQVHMQEVLDWDYIFPKILQKHMVAKYGLRIMYLEKALHFHLVSHA